MSQDHDRQLRAVLRHAMTWAVAWAFAGGAVVAAVGLFDPNPAIESLPERVGLALFAGAGWGVRFGIAGAVVGTAFALALRIAFRGRRLGDLNPVWFAVAGAVAGGLGVPLYLQAMNVLTGGPIPWSLVADDAVWASVFGAAVAGGSILLARRAEALSPGVERQLLGEETLAGGLSQPRRESASDRAPPTPGAPPRRRAAPASSGSASVASRAGPGWPR